ncbi:DUF547 domain-containing protein [Halosegnis sp.]|uniref:DUF547 domain-containing protein n=1 Tax=Halosegnis sp. TaxID=2864959 RepID=UPI0035D3FC0E
MTEVAAGERPINPVAHSRRLLDAVRQDEGVEEAFAAVATLEEATLQPVREERPAALAFWLNCYNAATQRLLAERPGLYESPLRMVRFFRAEAITVAGTPLSLDDIEHGILRGSRSKYGLGYLPRLADGPFIDRYRLALDPRVHFALNCGAASCPAVRYYDPDEVDAQLDRASETYLASTVDYDPDAGEVRLPRLFLWYHGDFADPVGLLARYGIIPEGADPSVRYQSWDWTQAPGKFAD